VTEAAIPPTVGHRHWFRGSIDKKDLSYLNKSPTARIVRTGNALLVPRHSRTIVDLCQVSRTVEDGRATMARDLGYPGSVVGGGDQS
jgi:hypothetical protein